MSAENISLEEAKQDKLFYFVANVVVYREVDGRCLLLKRSESEKVHPGKYAVPGGKLEWGDLDINNPTRKNGEVLDFEDAVEKMLQREVHEEAGIDIGTDLRYINSVAYIRPDGVPTVMVKFAAKYMSGEVVLEKGSFDGFVWANEEEARDLPCIMGIQDELAKTISIFKR
ncbi:MAG: NUDIX hydrolase [Patescibacteria group bacterium]|nr:NUDIX hydrolase [Patescibacteria group bacterium]